MRVHMITHATVGWVKENATTAEGALRLRCGYGAAPDTLDLWTKTKGEIQGAIQGRANWEGEMFVAGAFEKDGSEISGWLGREVRYSIGSGSGQAKLPPALSTGR